MKIRTYVLLFFELSVYYITATIVIIIIIIIIKLEKTIIEAPVPTTNLPPPFGLTLATALAVELDATAAVLRVTVPALVVLTAVVALDIDTLLAIPLAVKMPPPPPDIDAEVDDERPELPPTVAARTNTKSFNTTALSAMMGVPIACRLLFLKDAAVTITVSAGLPPPDDAAPDTESAVGYAVGLGPVVSSEEAG